ERLWQRGDKPPDRFAVPPAQQLRFRRRLRLLPQRRLLCRRFVFVTFDRSRCRALPCKLGLAGVFQDGQKPWLHRRTAVALEMTQRPQIAFLHGILSVGDIAHQVMRKRENVVEMRQRGVAKTPRSVMLVMS